MVSLKRSKIQETKLAPAEVATDRPEFPWGARLSFETEDIKKLPILETVNVDDVLVITAIARVCEMSVDERADMETPSRRVGLQIESIEISPEEEEEMTIEKALQEAKYKNTHRPIKSTRTNPLIRAKVQYQSE